MGPSYGFLGLLRVPFRVHVEYIVYSRYIRMPVLRTILGADGFHITITHVEDRLFIGRRSSNVRGDMKHHV